MNRSTNANAGMGNNSNTSDCPFRSKDFWLAIRNNRFAVPDGYTPSELLPDLLEMLGCVDGQLRDRTCWVILHVWIRGGLYTRDEVLGMTKHLLANLRMGIEEVEGDLAFLRAFSALTLASIADYHLKAKVWPPGDIGEIVDAALNYVRDEQDLRGYVEGKGWVDGIGHTLDLLAYLVRCPEVGGPELERILDVLSAKVLALTPKYPAFAAIEGFRLGEVLIRVVRREILSLDAVISWMRRFDRTGKQDEIDYYAGPWRKGMDFLTALYVQVQNSDLPAGAREKLTPVVADVLKTYNRSMSVS